MKTNRQGTTRIVFELKTVVVKVPNFRDGWRLFLLGLLCNLQERQFGALDWPDLCPIVWSSWGGWVVVMKKARMMTRGEFDRFDANGFIEDGFAGHLPVEPKMSSFGVYDGNVVAVDYGS